MPSSSGVLVDLGSVLPGSIIDVETKSRHYQIECLGGDAVRISGHPKYCPQPVEANIPGSINRAGILEAGLIGAGNRLMFRMPGQRPVTTSRVIRVHTQRPEGSTASSSIPPGSDSSPSIH
jgi:hypothetical protein